MPYRGPGFRPRFSAAAGGPGDGLPVATRRIAKEAERVAAPGAGDQPGTGPAAMKEVSEGAE
jgi:hypothetical protein